MITIPSMPTRFRPLPQLELNLSLSELRALAFVLDRIVSPESYTGGLCLSVSKKLRELGLNTMQIACEFSKAVDEGMNPQEGNTHNQYITSYLYRVWSESITSKEIAAIRDAWAKHIARSIYEQIGD